MVIVAFAIVYIVWGSTYFFIQKAIQGFPPMLLGAVRFLIAGGLMLGWSLLRGEKVFVKKDIGYASVSGVLMLFVGTEDKSVAMAPTCLCPDSARPFLGLSTRHPLRLAFIDPPDDDDFQVDAPGWSATSH